MPRNHTMNAHQHLFGPPRVWGLFVAMLLAAGAAPGQTLEPVKDADAKPTTGRANSKQTTGTTTTTITTTRTTTITGKTKKTTIRVDGVYESDAAGLGDWTAPADAEFIFKCWAGGGCGADPI